MYNLYTESSQSQSSNRFYGYSPREGAVILCTDLNQSESRKLHKVHPPREGAVNFCTNGNQSDPKYRTQCSGRVPEHSRISCNKTQSSPVSICKISNPSVPYCQHNLGTSGSLTCKNLSFLDMSNAMEEPIMDESFRRLLNKFAPLNRIPLGRLRPIRRQKAKRPRRVSSAVAGDLRHTKFATIIANFRKQRMIKPRRATKQVNRVSLAQRIVAKDKKNHYRV